MAIKFCTVTPNICQSLEWNLHNVKFLVSRILRWLVDFWENLCTSGLKVVYQINGSLKPLFYFSHTFFCYKRGIVMCNTVSAAGSVKTLHRQRNILVLSSTVGIRHIEMIRPWTEQLRERYH